MLAIVRETEVLIYWLRGEAALGRGTFQVCHVVVAVGTGVEGVVLGRSQGWSGDICPGL